MIDYHCHILPGIDDGPSTLDESIQMARLLSEAGFTSVYCTPHLIRNLYDASHADVQRSIKTLQAELDRKGIALRLLAGREYYLDNHCHEYLNDLMPLEGTRYLLIEIPSGSHQSMILDIITAIMRKGFIPMIAHPERCRILANHQSHKIPKSLGFFSRNTIRGRIEQEYSYYRIDLLDWLFGCECGFQCNVGSFAGMYGRSIREGAKRFWQQKVYTHYGTDAHSTEFLVKLTSEMRKTKSLTYSYLHSHRAGRLQAALI